jgi:hypothetical protein
MECPVCGYVMSPFDDECPRCKRMAAKAPPEPATAPEAPPEPGPPLPVAPPEPQPVSKEQTVVLVPAAMAGQRRPDALTWGLIGIGIAVVALLAGVLYTLWHKPAPPGGTVAQSPPQQAQPMQAQPGSYATIPPQQSPPATTNAPSLLQGDAANAEAMRTSGENLLQGDEYNAEAPVKEPTSWREVTRFTGSGTTTTSPIHVRMPWRMRYFTGYSSGSDMDLDMFSIFPNKGPLSLPIVTVQNQPETWGEGYATSGGTFPLFVGTTYNNWVVIVEQGE